MRRALLHRLNYVFGVIYFFLLIVIVLGFGIYVLSTGLNILVGNPPIQNITFADRLFDFIFDTMLFVFFVISLAVSSSRTLVYFFPQFSKKDTTEKPANQLPLDIVKFVSLEDERLIIDAIEKLSPRVYKFEIARETGLSRMKVHRNLLKLEERGIVEIEKVGKNSRVRFTKWLSPHGLPSPIVE